MLKNRTVSEVRELKGKIKLHIDYLKEELKRTEAELSQLQESCCHVNQDSQTEYNCTEYWCNDCDKTWSKINTTHLKKL